MDIFGVRLRQSGLVSLVLFFVLLFLPYVPPQYKLLHYAVLAVLLFDAFVKLLNIPELRIVSSAAYSFALAFVTATYFQVFGYPFSYLAALMFVIDGILKLIPGDQKILFIDEYKLRHFWSALVTVLLGLALMFSVLIIHPALSVLIGIFLVFDGVTKLSYALEI